MVLGTDTGGPPDYRCSNCSSQAIKLPFKFCFYGKMYDTVYINNKGNLSFVNPVFTFSSKGLPAGNDTLMLDGFWADVDNIPAPLSDIYYKITPTHMIVQWNNVGYNAFDDDLYDDIQITITNGADSILPPGNNVSYCYWLMRWATDGGFGDATARVGVNKGDNVHYAQFGTFCLPGTKYYGPFDTNSGLYWLDNKSFTFNTCVTGNNIPPVILNPGICDTVTVCAGDSMTFAASFLCPQQSQTATVSASSPGLSGFTTSTSNVNSLYTISCKIVAAIKDTGSYTVNITATDNGSPALTNSVPFTVIIKACDSVSGINEVKLNKGFAVYPNPNNGTFIIQSSLIGNGPLAEVYNLLGEKIYSQLYTNYPFSIDLSSQSKGLYFIKLFNEGMLVGIEKVVIQ
jgi:hypothetical protein